MDPHPIDRLFREKMDGLEVTPSAYSWHRIEKQLKPNRKSAYYRVVAAVILLAVSWILIPNQPDSEVQTADIQITHPPAQAIEDFKVPVMITFKEKVKSQKNSPIPVINARQLLSEKSSESETLQDVIKDSSVAELESMKALVVNVSELPVLEGLRVETIGEKKELRKGTVKITYIASSEADNTPDGTSRFRKFMAFAEKIAPGEVLADMKIAKDNLLNGRLKNKKREVR